VKVKKPKKAVRSKTARKGAGAKKVARKPPTRARAHEEKYSQPGAPWWKAYIP